MRDWKASQRHKLLFFFAAAAVMRIKVKKNPQLQKLLKAYKDSTLSRNGTPVSTELFVHHRSSSKVSEIFSLGYSS